MMTKEKIFHILRAASGILQCNEFLLVGSSVVILAGKHIPASMMNTPEIDLFPTGSSDPEQASDMLSGSIGHDSPFHKTFGYYCDGVSENTAILPTDWKDRSVTQKIGDITVTHPDLQDIALAKLCAWREKDIHWLEEGIRSGLLKHATMSERARNLPPERCPQPEVVADRLKTIAPACP